MVGRPAARHSCPNKVGAGWRRPIDVDRMMPAHVLDRAAAHQKPAAMLGDQRRRLGGLFLVGLRVVDPDQADQIGAHCFLRNIGFRPSLPGSVSV